jgi:aryl-alcohol dehydrogenase-like predicted oxidoreductase
MRQNDFRRMIEMASRRDFLQYTGAAVLASAQPFAWAEQTLSTRPIPGTDDHLAIIGLGNSQAFRNGDRETARQLLEIFLSRGGNYVDAGGPSGFLVGELGQAMSKTDQLFLGNYIRPGSEYRADARALAVAQGKEMLDLVHTRDLQGFRANHDDFRALREEGLTRFIGVARIGPEAIESMTSLIDDGLVDFIQVNYSMLEPEAGERLLPMAQENGIGVAISRPFINGDYFSVVRGKELPEWAAEFDCDSWAQFSLKFILSNPAVNCVLTETANPKHAIDNLGAGVGRLPDAAMRKRMLEHMRSLV